MWYWVIYHKLLKVTTLTTFEISSLWGFVTLWMSLLLGSKNLFNLQYMYVPAIWVGSSRLDRVVSCGQENLRDQYRKL